MVGSLTPYLMEGLIPGLEASTCCFWWSELYLRTNALTYKKLNLPNFIASCFNSQVRNDWVAVSTLCIIINDSFFTKMMDERN